MMFDTETKKFLKGMIKQQLIIVPDGDRVGLCDFFIKCINEVKEELNPKDHLKAALNQALKNEAFEEAQTIEKLLANRNK